MQSIGGLAHRIPHVLGAAARTVLTLAARDAGWAPAPLILPLAEAARAHRMLKQRTAPAKIVLAVAGDAAPFSADAKVPRRFVREPPRPAARVTY